MSIQDALNEVRKTDVTKTIHQKEYPAISPTRRELSQAGRTVLITGGGTGVGFAMARSFLHASAETIVIVGRRVDVLDTARVNLEKEAKSADKETRVLTFPCDALKKDDIDAVWKELETQGVFVDVFVANAAKFTEPEPLLALGTDEVWSQMETNVKSPLYFAEKLHAQKGASEKQKFIVNVSTGSIHGTTHPEVIKRPAYTLSKLSGTLLFQLLAQDYPHDKTQIVSFHPGLIHNAYWQSLGLGPELFDSEELLGNFAVWTASKEAAFLHGRFVWCSWDVEELATGEIRKRIDEDPFYLKASIVGLRQGLSA